MTSGRSGKEISETFEIGENVGRHPGSLSLEDNCNYEDKIKNGEISGDKSAKLTAEIAKLRSENERQKTDCEILKSIGSLDTVRFNDIYELHKFEY